MADYDLKESLEQVNWLIKEGIAELVFVNSEIGLTLTDEGKKITGELKGTEEASCLRNALQTIEIVASLDEVLIRLEHGSRANHRKIKVSNK